MAGRTGSRPPFAFAGISRYKPLMHSLPLFMKLAGQPVILVGAGNGADARRRLIERAGGRIVGPDEPAADEARIAFIALADDVQAEVMATELKARGLLVNVTDRPELCDFTMPAIVERDPVLIAVATGGASAGLAKAVRQRIERLLPAGLGGVARALGEARTAIRARWPDADLRRRALDAALREGGALDPLAEHGADTVTAWLADPALMQAERTETILLASADPDDLTLRVARLLGEADRILHDPAVPEAILARARADAVRISLRAGESPAPGAGLTIILRMQAM